MGQFEGEARRLVDSLPQGGGQKNAIGISRGGRTTKVHALGDIIGRPLRLVLRPGNTSDIRGTDLLVADAARIKRMIADRGYAANTLCATLRAGNAIPIIPGRRNRKRPVQYDERRYTNCWRVEAMFCHLKELASPPFRSAASPPNATRWPGTFSKACTPPAQSPSRPGSTGSNSYASAEEFDSYYCWIGGGFPGPRFSDSSCLREVGGRLGWDEPCWWICGSG